MDHERQIQSEGSTKNGADAASVAGVPDAAIAPAAIDDDALRVLSVLKRNRKQQELLYRTLLYCAVPRRFDDVEAFLPGQPEMEFGQILQSPRTLIGFLIDAGGIAEADAPEAGRLDGTETTSDAEPYLVTTEAGARAARAFDPLVRLGSLVAAKPTRREAFLLFLELCAEPRTFAQIEHWYKTEMPSLCRAVDTSALDADYFVSQLEKAGGLVWKKAWITTRKGIEFAEHLRREKQEQRVSAKEDCACRIA